jgi:hypothetical protein
MKVLNCCEVRKVGGGGGGGGGGDDDDDDDDVFFGKETPIFCSLRYDLSTVLFYRLNAQ